jgi:hypothetical protein
VSNALELAIESLVAILLLLTISYCIVLNSRLKRLKADEQALKATISELITATEIAEGAIAGLKLTVRDCDQTLRARLRAAERLSGSIAGQLKAGDEILKRLTQIAAAAKPAAALTPVAPDAKIAAAAAHAFAERRRLRSGGAAA